MNSIIYRIRSRIEKFKERIFSPVTHPASKLLAKLVMGNKQKYPKHLDFLGRVTHPPSKLLAKVGKQNSRGKTKLRYPKHLDFLAWVTHPPRKLLAKIVVGKQN